MGRVGTAPTAAAASAALAGVPDAISRRDGVRRCEGAAPAAAPAAAAELVRLATTAAAPCAPADLVRLFLQAAALSAAVRARQPAA